MKALSIRQPWAWAIIHAGKDIENRQWPTKFRGRILIHAGKVMTQEDYDSCMDYVDKLIPLDRTATLSRRARVVNGGAPRGGIVGEADLVDCVTEHDSPWFFGRYGFVLRNVRPLPFFPCSGQLGFFSIVLPREPASVADRLLDLVEGASPFEPETNWIESELSSHYYSRREP